MAETNDWTAMTMKFQSITRVEDQTHLHQQCLRLCQQYLGGNWTKLSVNDVEINRLTGGMINKVYHCKIPDNLRDEGTEPKEVAIRLYNSFDYQTLQLTDNTFENNIKYALLSDNGFGPHVYGVDQVGVLLKYYQHRLFAENDLYNKSLLRQVAIILARIHAMKPPIDKSRASIKDIIFSSNTLINQKLDVKRKLFEDYNCKTLLDFDLKAETDWVLAKIKSFNSPLVFSHNDFRFGNTMVTEKDGIIIGDYDLTDYFYRGFDFATYFYDFVQLGEKSFGFKDETIVRYFIDKYLTESAVINGKQYLDNENNKTEHILREMKAYALVYSTFLINSLLVNEVWKLPLSDELILQTVASEVERFLAIKKLLDDF